VTASILETVLAPGLLRWTLHHPRKRNALTPDMLAWLERRSNELAGEVVILNGDGETSFCAGFDLDALPDAPPEDCPPTTRSRAPPPPCAAPTPPSSPRCTATSSAPASSSRAAATSASPATTPASRSPPRASASSTTPTASPPCTTCSARP
jgi:hypothetical protein